MPYELEHTGGARLARTAGETIRGQRPVRLRASIVRLCTVVLELREVGQRDIRLAGRDGGWGRVRGDGDLAKASREPENRRE